MRVIILFLFILPAVLLQAQNVGIGTTTPNAPLQFGNGSANRKIVLYDVNNNEHQFFGLGLNSGELRYQINEANSGVAHKFFAGLNSSSSLELMRIQGNGLVGIGSTNPALGGLVVDKKIGATNAVFGSNTTGVAIESDFPGIGFNTYWNSGRKAIATGYGGYIGLNPSGGGMSLAVSSSSSTAGNPITVNTALYIKPDGSVGIGTTAPNGQLQLSNSVQNRKIVLYEPGNNDHEFYGFGINGFTLRYQVPAATDNHVFYSGIDPNGSNELFRINGNGNVGVGVNDPAYRLDVGARMRIRSSSGGNTAGLWLNNAANNASPAFIGMQSDNQVGFLGNNGAGWGLTMNTQNGSLNINGVPGQVGQILMSNGSSNNASWAWPGAYLTTNESGWSIFNQLSGSGPHDFTNSTFTINLSTQARVILFYKTSTLKPCSVGSCNTKWRLEVYNNGSIVQVLYLDGTAYAGPNSDYWTTNTTSGPTFFTLSPGSYTFSFAGTNIFNEPDVGFHASYIIINM